MGMFDKAKDLAKGQTDKIDDAVAKAGDLVDEKTGGKFSSQVDKAEEMAKSKLAEQLDDE